jgi:hypothetical protein
LYESLTRESRARAHRRGTFHDLKFVWASWIWWYIMNTMMLENHRSSS